MPYTHDQQMQFIHRFLKKSFFDTDKTRLERIKTLESKQRIHFLNEFLNIEVGKELDTTRIGYVPFDGQSYKVLLAPGGPEIKPQNRELTRYRLIYGPVDFYLDSPQNPIEIPLITACAPNLMGTSEIDLKKFTFPLTAEQEAQKRIKAPDSGNTDDDNSPKRVLNREAYELECAKLANFIVGLVKSENKKRLVMPAFGVGAYIAQLDDPSKKLAKEIMYNAFAKAAVDHQIQIDWVLKSNNPMKIRYKELQGYSIKKVYQKDILEYAQKLIEEEENLVLLNPGSDRTIGGAYPKQGVETLEEQYAQRSDLIFLHTVFNKDLVDQFQVDFAKRKNQKNVASPKIIATQIENKLDLSEHPWVSLEEDRYRVSFKFQESAQKLACLWDDGNVYLKGQYAVVYLTNDQVQKLLTTPKTGLTRSAKFEAPYQANPAKKPQVGPEVKPQKAVRPNKQMIDNPLKVGSESKADAQQKIRPEEAEPKKAVELHNPRIDKPRLDTSPELGSESKANAQQEVEPEPKPESQKTAEPNKPRIDTPPELGSGSKANAPQEVEPELKAEPQKTAEPNKPRIDTPPEVGYKFKVDSQQEVKLEPEVDPQKTAEPRIDTLHELGSDADAQQKVKPEPTEPSKPHPIQSRRHAPNSVTPTNTSTPQPAKKPISMKIISGFIAAAGILAALAVVFMVVNLGTAGIVSASLGAAALLTGIGLYAYNHSKKDKQPVNSPDATSRAII